LVPLAQWFRRRLKFSHNEDRHKVKTKAHIVLTCFSGWLYSWEKFEDTKEVIRSHNSKNIQFNGQKKNDNKMVGKSLYRKLIIEQHESH
jgi:hypothetical protein